MSVILILVKTVVPVLIWCMIINVNVTMVSMETIVKMVRRVFFFYYGITYGL